MQDFFAQRPYLSAAALGVLFFCVGIPIWGIYYAYTPVNLWLISTFAVNGQAAVFNIATYSHQLVVQVLIALPFAYFLSRIRPEKSWTYVWVALVVTFAVMLSRFISSITTPTEFETAMRVRVFLESTFVTVAALAVAYYIVVKLRHREDEV